MAERARDGSTERATGGAASVLADLPGPLWEGLASALRRLADEVPPERLPRRLLPFLRIRVEHLDRPEVRHAVRVCVPVDARLRADLLESLPADLVAAAAEDDVARLEERFGAPVATAALVGHGRWEALAVLSDRIAAALLEDRAAEGPHDGEAADDERGAAGRSALVAQLTEKLEEAERRATAAESRAAHAQRRAEHAAGRVAELEQMVADLRAELAEEQRDHRKRLARLQRQAREGRDASRDADARLARVGQQLERALDELQSQGQPQGVAGDRGDDAADGAEADDTADGRSRHRQAAALVPRRVPPATPGRPCLLPAGVTPRSEAAVLALLQVDRLELILDGYNVTMDLRGRPSASLDDQRRWLVRNVAGLAATSPVRPTVVFDGTDVAAPAPAARGVRTVFTSGDELADDRIRAFVRGLDEHTPVLVVTSDRQVRDDVAALGADVAASAVFLKAVGASA